jgi:hypothetical protein
MKALISLNENNRIVEVKPDNKSFPIAEPLKWVDCPNDCTSEWTYVDSQFIEPVPPLPVIPSIVSMRQARLALLQSNLLETVNTAINQGSEADKITWEYATEVSRDDALVTNLSAALGLTSEQLDSLFTLASSL